MRLLEMLLLAANLLGIVILLLRNKWGRIQKISLAAAFAAVGSMMLLQLLMEGYRWMMVPAYLASMLLLWKTAFRLLRKAQDRCSGKWLAYFGYAGLIGLLVLSGLSSSLLPVIHLPVPDGQFKVGTVSFYWTDSTRLELATPEPEDKREVPVQIWYPAQASREKPALLFGSNRALLEEYAKGLKLPGFALQYWRYFQTNSYLEAFLLPSSTSYPVVLVSHGLGTGKVFHVSQAEYLASHGYVVVALEHPYSSSAALLSGGNIAGFRTPLSSKEIMKEANELGEVWTADVAFSIRQLKELNSGKLPSPFKGKLDLEHIGIMGHSFGGGAAYQATRLMEDIAAGINMDGTLFGLDTKQPLVKPFMFMQAESSMKTAEKITEAPADIRGHLELEAQAIQEANGSGGLQVVIQGAEHFNFTDHQLYTPLFQYVGLTGRIQGERGAELVNRYVLAFFNKHLRGMDAPLLDGPNSRYPEVRFEPKP